MLTSLSYFSLLRKCKATEIFILKKIATEMEQLVEHLPCAWVFK